MLFLVQYLRIVWARKWIVLALFIVISIAGTAYVLNLPRQYTAETSLIVDIRIDPALGAMAPALMAPSYMATQIEILKSERVASRAVKILGVERSAAAVAQWREATNAKIPLAVVSAAAIPITNRLILPPSRATEVFLERAQAAMAFGCHVATL